MTAEEYQRYYRKAKKKFPRLTQKAMRELHKAYVTAGDRTAAFVRSASISGLSREESKAYAAFQAQLKKSAEKIATELTGTIPDVSKTAVEEIADINIKHLSDVLVPASSDVTKTGIKKVYQGVNDRVIRDLVGRISQKGYKFSELVWNTAGDFPVQMNRVVAAGIAQGRDVVKIAEDISGYVSGGRGILASRYGKLKRGTRAFLRRISDKVDYRALRLVRSELYMSLQNASVEQGKANPGCDDTFDWVVTAGGQHSCVCPDLESSGPYKEIRIPDYPHPNCRCTITPRLRENFDEDVIKWAEGGDVDYMDKWYEDVYNKGS